MKCKVNLYNNMSYTGKIIEKNNLFILLKTDYGYSKKINRIDILLIQSIFEM